MGWPSCVRLHHVHALSCWWHSKRLVYSDDGVCIGDSNKPDVSEGRGLCPSTHLAKLFLELLPPASCISGAFLCAFVSALTLQWSGRRKCCQVRSPRAYSCLVFRADERESLQLIKASRSVTGG